MVIFLTIENHEHVEKELRIHTLLQKVQNVLKLQTIQYTNSSSFHLSLIQETKLIYAAVCFTELK
jgi:hypothetical protein